MAIEIYKDGPLKGMASVSVLIEAQNVEYLQHAEIEIGYSLEQLADIAVNEAALNYARSNSLFKKADSND